MYFYTNIDFTHLPSDLLSCKGCGPGWEWSLRENGYVYMCGEIFVSSPKIIITLLVSYTPIQNGKYFCFFFFLKEERGVAGLSCWDYVMHERFISYVACDRKYIRNHYGGFRINYMTTAYHISGHCQCL